jgi:anti-sigma regulatory factor (Ser/Thr protein kinase)
MNLAREVPPRFTGNRVSTEARPRPMLARVGPSSPGSSKRAPHGEDIRTTSLTDPSLQSTDAGATITIWLQPEPTAPAIARRAVNELAASSRLETRNAVELVVSELVTNSVKHAGLRPEDRIGLAAQRTPDRIRVEVSDPGPGFEPPRVNPTVLLRPSGWGLYLVGRLADRWGVDLSAGTRVWSEFDL